jgi:hypothetical protein
LNPSQLRTFFEEQQMSRPDKDTPIEPIVNILRATEKWSATHKDTLLEVDEPEHLEGLSAEGDALEAASNAFEREKRDDVDLTPKRDALVVSVRQLLTATVAALRLVHQKAEPKVLRAVTRRFVQRAPSTVRSLDGAQRAMNRVVAACDATPSAAGRNTPKLRAMAAVKLVEIKALQDDYARESQEYSQAAANLVARRASALARITLLQLAAEAVSFENMQPLDDLNAIFTALNPVAPSRSTGDDILEGDSDLGDLSDPDDDLDET